MWAVWNILRTLIWWTVVFPSATVAGALMGFAAATELALRHGNPAWDPYHPIRTIGLRPAAFDIEPAARADE